MAVWGRKWCDVFGRLGIYNLYTKKEEKIWPGHCKNKRRSYKLNDREHSKGLRERKMIGEGDHSISCEHTE